MSIKSLYTQTLPKDMAATVRGIPAPEDCEVFQSHPTSYDEGENQWTQWAEAWKNPQTGLWTLEEYKRFVTAESSEDKNGNNNVRQKKTVAQNVSFFDALHYCAYEEVSRKTGGANMTGTIDSVHYSEVAKQTNQPLDAQALPHPAAHGRILTDGMFDDAACDMARKTKTTALVSHRRSVTAQLINFEKLGVGDVSSRNASIVAQNKIIQKETLIKRFESAIDAASRYKDVKANNLDDPSFLKEILSDITPTVFGWSAERRPVMHGMGYGYTAFAALMCTALQPPSIHPLEYTDDVAVLGLGITALATMAPTVWRASRSLANNLLASTSLNRKIAALPDCALKTEIKSHRAMIKASDHFAKAAKIFDTHGCKSKWHLHRAFRQVNKGARITGMSKLEKDQLRLALVERRFPSTNDIKQSVTKAQYNLRGVFNKLEKEINRSDDIPALEHKEEIPMDILAAQKSKTVVPK